MERIIQDDVLTADEARFIRREIVYNGTFPLYFSKSTTSKFPYFVHTLMRRNSGGRANSDLFNFFNIIFRRFCAENNIQVNDITRAAINVSFNNAKYFMADAHVDNYYKHKVFILYLNDLPLEDNNYNNTILFNKKITEGNPSIIDIDSDNFDFEIQEEIQPKLGRGLCFDGSQYHSMRWPPAGHLRYILVMNFT